MKTARTNTVQLTKEGLDQLTKEVADLKTNKLPAVIERISKAREDGDLSENSAYIFGKQEQEFLEGRIAELEEIIQNSTVLPVSKQKGVVGIGCKVTVTAKGKKVRFMIVGEWEASPAQQKISSSSPLGKALLGRKAGEQVEIEAPAGKVIYTITDIE